MFEQAKAAIAEDGILQKAVQAGEEQIAQAGLKAAHLKEKLSHVVEDGVSATRKAIKRSRYAAEDMIDETAYRIKRDPLRCVAITFGVGLGLGTLIGWLTTRKGCKD